MKLACLQLDIAWHDKPRNYARVRELLRGNDLVGGLLLLPEMFATGFSMDVPAIAEEAGGPTERFLADLARETGAAVLGGLVRRGPDGKGRNRALAFSPAGERLADYAKLHPFTFGEESSHFAGGDRVATFACGPDARVAPAICYDLRFPELFRAAVGAAGEGAEIIAVIANWPAEREFHWLTLLQARAIENQCFIAGCNRVGRDPAHLYGGRSLIVDPRGRILADGGPAEGLVVAEADLSDLREYRRAFPALADRRLDLFPPAGEMNLRP